MKLSIKYIVYFFSSFLIFFTVGLYTYYKYKFPRFQDINSEFYNLYPKDIILKIGGFLNLPQQRIQHFLNFPVKKNKKTLRIGAFGDSHTFGDEVEKTATYPYQLQALFNKNFPNHPIEVLNFGATAIGFPEQFFLWEKYAQTYQLDYILLGPGGFYPIRNTLFAFHNIGYWIPKNRFILTEDLQIKEVHIKGNTVQERFKNYYRLIPSWTALRYDKQPFKIYEILFPFLRYKIKNPFYYTKLSKEDESIAINKQLLKKIKKIYPKKILFFTNFSWIYYLYKFHNISKLSNTSNLFYKLYNLNLITPANSFYKVFWHESSLGNELIAQFYFNALLGRKNFFVNTIHCYFKDNQKTSIQNNPEIKNLDSVNQIEILGKGNILLSLRANISDHHYKEGTYQKYKKDGTKNFLTFLNTDNFLRSVYIPLSFQLKEGMKIYIQLRNKKRIELGAIQALDAYNKFFALYSNDMITDADYTYTHLFVY
ncbi:MAG: hypothetical protein OXN83_05110, partial [Oligoflexia bacterium]|nr:hypothetical protein [Oligoflexia bacterium]